MAITFTKEQESEIVASLEVLHEAMLTFATIGAFGEFEQENIDAMKLALIAPLAALETTVEEFTKKYARARQIIEEAHSESVDTTPEPALP